MRLRFPPHRIITMQRKISRRAIVKGGLIAGALIPAMGLMADSAAAAGLPALDPKDPTAQALGFVTDASKVDAKTNATYKPNQKCSTCARAARSGSLASVVEFRPSHGTARYFAPQCLMRSSRRNIPNFSLYGETPATAQTDGVHIE